MSKRERIEELERKIAELEARIIALETRPYTHKPFMPYGPYGPVIWPNTTDPLDGYPYRITYKTDGTTLTGVQ